MANVNSATISGNLTRDPELRTTPSGAVVVSFAVAVNRRYKDESAEDGYAEEVSFIDVTVWGNFGELIARKLRKGDSATVQGRLRQSRWETEDGSKRSRVELVADQIDSDGLFRSKDEDNDPTAAASDESASAEKPKATQLAAEDDLPF